VIIPNSYSQINLRFVGSSVPQGAEVVFGINPVGGSPDPADVAQVVGDHWIAEVLFAQVDDIALGSVLCKNGPNATGASAEVAFGDVGGSASLGWTPQVSVLVQKRSNTFGGRKNRGRMYVPGYPEDTANQSGLITGSLAGLQAEYDAFLAALSASGLPMVILHNELADTPTVVDVLEVQSTIATQRRRVR